MNINKVCETPIYLQVKQYILDEISRGRLLPGGKVESETEISEKFGISRVTVRKAYGELVDEGYLVRKRGKGTFLRDVQYYMDLSNSRSFSATCYSLGMQPSTKVLCLDYVRADLKVAAALGIEPGVEIAHAQRLRFADDVPVMLEDDYYAQPYHDIIEEDLSQSISKLIESKYGIAKSHQSHYRITIGYTDPQESKLLNTKNQTPVLVVCGTLFDNNNEPIYYTKMRHMQERCVLIL